MSRRANVGILSIQDCHPLCETFEQDLPPSPTIFDFDHTGPVLNQC